MNKTVFYALKTWVLGLLDKLLHNVPDPTNDTDAANKRYVDEHSNAYDAILQIDFGTPGESMGGEATLTMLKGSCSDVYAKAVSGELVRVLIKEIGLGKAADDEASTVNPTHIAPNPYIDNAILMSFYDGNVAYIRAYDWYGNIIEVRT